jgi:hypothetical protein
MTNHIETRDEILKALRAELVGPSPLGNEIDCNQPIQFNEPSEAYGPFRQAGSGEEILIRDSPTKRYGVGVLYPLGTGFDEEPTTDTSTDLEPLNGEALESSISDDLLQQIQSISERGGKLPDETVNDLDLSTTNSFKPSSMGISFLCYLPPGSSIKVKATGGRYKKKGVHVAGQERIWWCREPVEIDAEFSSNELASNSLARVIKPGEVSTTTKGLNINLELYCRPHHKADEYLITLCLINRDKASNSSPEACLFQSYFIAEIEPSELGGEILPYPRPETGRRLNEEEESLDLLYRKTQTYAVGHGCAADWNKGPEGKGIRMVSAECLPTFETPSMTPDVQRDDGTPIEVSMAELAGLSDKSDGISALEEVVRLYESWINKQLEEAESLNQHYQSPAKRHLEKCSIALERMKDGLEFLRSDSNALRAFKLANEAILIQQARSGRDLRVLSYDKANIRLKLSEEYPEIDLLNLKNRGKWRAFQIAFILMTLTSTAEHTHPDRDAVELIWFPTGGGKTEAYLGLAAFSLFMRRLSNKDDDGVHILMRYTLRLLTAQQFQRASGLICAMEHIRRREASDLGSTEFSIGIWLGGETTPNSRIDAISNLKSLKSSSKYGVENKFILTKCPWCAAQIGPIKYSGKIPNNAPKVAGYEASGNTVKFKCTDQKCEFKAGLPVYVIDQDIYEVTPSLVIGTVDKFAMLAWRPEARSLFGIAPDGSRRFSPPGLIIQDELHLISGPLGSMYGLYEVAINELCTDRRGQIPTRPKIISSTATIRRYEDQIKALYGCKKVSLFPPPGLEDGDSFFAKYAMDESGNLRRGRMYVGVHAPGLGSMQTVQTRTFSSLLQASVALEPESRDPWWTLMLFFNSLRELGTTLTLFQSDIPDYFGVLKNRTGAKPDQLRNYGYLNLKELTGRLKSDEVPEAIEALEITTTSVKDPIDVCLASNIIEVGVDIDRLSLMCIVGQPKTTSQYIQVSGRVGRKWWERPGLVVTLYGAAKPRDRSHFEKFRSYHEKLYAQVEPTSVTPFSPPVLDRALHAALVSFVRQMGDENVTQSPYPFPQNLVDRFREVLIERVQVVDDGEANNLISLFEKRSNQWEKWKRTIWDSGEQEKETPLLRYAGEYVPSTEAKISWATPTSLRNVDAECQAEITQLYIKEEIENA